MSCLGNKMKLSLYGTSRGNGVGAILENFPKGIKIDNQAIDKILLRRSPKNKTGATERVEADKYQFLSGVENGITTGEKIDIFIPNTDVKNEEMRFIPKPSHADLGMYYKYGKNADFRGGAHFSGRLTAPICIVGALCESVLKEKGISIYSHIYSLGDIYDIPFLSCDIEKIISADLKNKSIPTVDFSTAEKMVEKISKAKQNGDSIGAIIECGVFGMKKGIGDAYFDGIEGRISQAIFGIGGVKGIEFGNGFECARLLGSQNNDAIYIKDGEIFTKTNNAGGILGGISNGMPIIFRAAIKPTPSISVEQNSVDLEKMENTVVKFSGRNDACIAIRALPCVEALCAYVLYDMLIENEGEI